MLDEYTRQCVAIRVERQIRSEQVLATLWQAMTTYGIPQHIRSDNGSEFIAQKIQPGFRENQIKTLYIDPDSPWQNGYIESFHSRFRVHCYLNYPLQSSIARNTICQDSVFPSHKKQRLHVQKNSCIDITIVNEFIEYFAERYVPHRRVLNRL